MDGRRWKLALAGGLLSAAVGCNTTPKTTAFALPAPPPAAPAKNVMLMPEPVDDAAAAKKEGPLASETLLVFAGSWVESVAMDPSKPPAEREKLLAQARQFYQEVLRRDANNVDALLGLGQMYLVTGEREPLALVEKKARELHPTNAKVWAWIAVRQGKAREWDNAAESYHQAVKLDPENRLYRIHLGFTLARGGRYEEGIAWLSRSMRPAEAHYNLALMMIHNGNADQARRALQQALEADPNFKPAADQLVALANGGPTAPLPPEAEVRPARYEEIPRAAPRTPTEPLPLGGARSAAPLPPTYMATTGWDSTLPPSGGR